MDLLRELERRRDKVQDQMREKQSELEAISRIISGMQREGISAKNRHATRNGTQTKTFARIGLTDAIRAVATEWGAPSGIRAILLNGGYRHTAKSPLLGNIFATCKRLAKEGEFEVREMSGRKEYRAAAKQENQ
jgi:hypothetical protein